MKSSNTLENSLLCSTVQQNNKSFDTFHKGCARGSKIMLLYAVGAAIDAQSFSNSFEGVHGVVTKSGKGSSIFMFYCIFMLQFFKVF